MPLRGEAQEPGPPAPGAPDRPRVFLDCNFHCDFDHFRREIAFVDWMRERQDADVHILGTSESTGGGGENFVLTMIGLRAQSSKRDTLRYVSRAGETEATTRAGLTRVLSLGLVRFAAGFPVDQRITVQYTEPEGAAARPRQRDPWNAWVFRPRINGFYEGEQHQLSYSINGGIGIQRITERLKILVNGNGNFHRSEFEIEGEPTVINTSKNYNQQLLIVSSLGGHWSAGFRERAAKSTFLNQDFSFEIGPALEFDVFPYKESSRRQMTFTYVIGGVMYNYEQETIFNRTTETRPSHLLNIAASSRQEWGSVDASLRATQYLHDLARHKIELRGGFEIQVLKGLSVNLFAEVARIKDQLYLPKEDLSPEDILLQRRQLGTDYSYELFGGVTFSFGSILNNVVNPRMNQID